MLRLVQPRRIDDDQLGIGPYTGFLSAYFNTREIAPLVGADPDKAAEAARLFMRAYAV